MFLKEMAKQFA